MPTVLSVRVLRDFRSRRSVDQSETDPRAPALDRAAPHGGWRELSGDATDPLPAGDEGDEAVNVTNSQLAVVRAVAVEQIAVRERVGVTGRVG